MALPDPARLDDGDVALNGGPIDFGSELFEERHDLPEPRVGARSDDDDTGRHLAGRWKREIEVACHDDAFLERREAPQSVVSRTAKRGRGDVQRFVSRSLEQARDVGRQILVNQEAQRHVPRRPRALRTPAPLEPEPR